MQIRPFKEVASEAFKEIKQYQTGEKKIIITGRPYLDNVFPVVNGSVSVVCAQSGVGKTTEMMKIINNIMDEKLNPTSKNFASLVVSLEMRVFNIVLRALNLKLKKKKFDIINSEFSEEEKALANEYWISLQDDRNYISQTPTSPKSFYQGCREFLLKHTDKETVVIGYDHLALTIADGGESRNTVIENLIEQVNNLKMEFSNVIFILVSQTNSDLIARAKDKDIMSQPRPSDLYYSQFTFQIADYVVVINNPMRNGIKEYSKIIPERYPNLKEYFLEEDSKGKVSLETYSVLYYHLLKCRESEDGLYIDIYAEDLGLDRKFKEDIKPANITVPLFTQTNLAPPAFENPNAGIIPVYDMSKAFEAPVVDDKNPF